MSEKVFVLRQPDTGVVLPEVTLVVYPTFASMRCAAIRYSGSSTGLDRKALGFTQAHNSEPVMRLCVKALTMRIIVHECTHAALLLRYSDECKDGMDDPECVVWWLDEAFCHIMDDLFTSVLDHIITNYSPDGLPLDLEERT